jgi:hypothetical protein
MENVLTVLVSNSWYAFLALATLTLILHGLLVYPRNLSKKAWKRMDYLWLSLTAIGLISATNTVGQRLSKNEVALASYRIPMVYKDLLSYLSPIKSNWVCRTFNEGKYSPDDYDRVVADYDRACQWRSKMYAVVSSIDTLHYQPILNVPDLQVVESESFKNAVLRNVQLYNSLILQRDGNASNVDSYSNNELTFFTPLLLIIGLALRITKITGELRHEK